MHQLLIRNALVFDGTGQAPVLQDVAVAGGRIAAAEEPARPRRQIFLKIIAPGARLRD